MAKPLGGFSVLVVDDNHLIRELVRAVLLRLGFGTIHSAESGKRAIEVLRMEEIDFVISDWRMPEMDGIDLVRHVRTSEKSANPVVPIIMLSGAAEAHEVMEARDAGVTEFLVKPFTIKELCTRIDEVIERPREFVLAGSYQGPSRRRRQADAPEEGERRKNRGRRLGKYS